ncbi:ATP-dependent RNA helicase DEAH12, chloroplastic [Pseudocercospora fuligena]|uniref:RBR-type E3 ubiquitin transferase n=1 Tax=Pseudocercospora fuligena TaxID=685502 RepID=A0A8H6VKW7_9PEZI|nr:ATP-dependent RNA helicase DEAH12, chloroplastic [Pseudocercospora fuligena]
MAEPKQSRFCESCGKHPPPHRMRDDLKGEACAHPSRNCTLCWQAWIDEQYDFRVPGKFSCIACRKTLTPADIRALGTPAQYERYLDTSLKIALSARKDFRYCMSPTCKSGQFHECGDIFECLECGHKHCVPCQLPWHPNLTCTEAQRRHETASKAMEKAFLDGPQLSDDEDEYDSDGEPSDRATKKCPGCPRNIQKRSGCEHMTCTMCGHEFCWLCLAVYGHHKKECRLWYDAGDGSLGVDDDEGDAEDADLDSPDINVDDTNFDAAANAGEDGGAADEALRPGEWDHMPKRSGGSTW